MAAAIKITMYVDGTLGRGNNQLTTVIKLPGYLPSAMDGQESSFTLAFPQSPCHRVLASARPLASRCLWNVSVWYDSQLNIAQFCTQCWLILSNTNIFLYLMQTVELGCCLVLIVTQWLLLMSGSVSDCPRSCGSLPAYCVCCRNMCTACHILVACDLSWHSELLLTTSLQLENNTAVCNAFCHHECSSPCLKGLYDEACQPAAGWSLSRTLILKQMIQLIHSHGAYEANLFASYDYSRVQKSGFANS